MKRKNLISLLICLTPLMLFPYLNNAFHLPKFIWIFFVTIFLLGFSIKERLFGYRNTFIVPVFLLFIWTVITLSRCTNIYSGLYSILIFILFITFYILVENVVVNDRFIDLFIKTLEINPEFEDAKQLFSEVMVHK